MWPKRICIVGGGTAGWLCALVLGDTARRGGHTCEITVIESSKIGTIGVGEGTTAMFRLLLQRLGLDEREFLCATGATIKYGIRHLDWRQIGHSYDGPIDDPHHVAGLGSGNPLDIFCVAQGKRVGTTHLFQHLLDGKRSPYAPGVEGCDVQLGPFHHAYHFDQALAGRWLKSKAKGVRLLDDQLLHVERDPVNGDVTGLKLEGGAQVKADFFIDCTGFRRVLISQMGARWEGYGDVLPVNRAIPFWLDIPEEEEIAPCTIAWAQGAGWMWKIPTQGRYGCGYVFSDVHISADDAKVEIERTLGQKIDVRTDIRIDAGRLDRQWIGNCVALGLSASFLEPLEATSIHGTIVQLLLLASVLARPDDRARKAFNMACTRQVDDFRDFIRLHYVSERRDTAFWRDVASSLPLELDARLKSWRRKLPGPEDFAPFPMGLPHIDHSLYVPVLDGLDLLDRSLARKWLSRRPELQDRTSRIAKLLEAEYRSAAGRAWGHREFLRALSVEVSG